MNSSAELHSGRGMRFGDWYACEYPERRTDPGHTWFDEGCRACMLAMGATIANGPPAAAMMHYDDGEAVIAPLAEIYEKEREAHGLRAIPSKEHR